MHGTDYQNIVFIICMFTKIVLLQKCIIDCRRGDVQRVRQAFPHRARDGAAQEADAHGCHNALPALSPRQERHQEALH